MKKFIVFLLFSALLIGCVSAGSASLNAYYSNGNIIITNSGTGMTQIYMDGKPVGYLGGNTSSLTVAAPSGASSVTIRGQADGFFGGDGGTVTVVIGGGSKTPDPHTPTGAPTGSPTGAPTTGPHYTNPPYTGGASVSAGSYNNGTLIVSVSGISDPAAIFIDGTPTGISIDAPGSKAVKVGTLTPGTHRVELYTFKDGVVSSTFTVSSQPEQHTHVFGSWTVTKSATCEGSGEQTHTCNICGYVETQRMSPIGHRYVVESENERFTNYRCTNCGKHMQKEKPVYATGTPLVNPNATQSPGLTTVTRNAYGHILWDSNAMAVDYDSYRDVLDITTVIIEVAQDTRTGKPTEIGLYLDGDLLNTLKTSGYTTLRYINGDAVLNIALANVSEAWFNTDEGINFYVFTTDPKASGGILVKVEAELASGSVIQPSNSLSGIVLKGATDILVTQNGVYDVSK